MIESTDWQESGRQPMTRKQQKLLCAACDDLARALPFWHGIRFSAPDYRHLIAAAVLGDRLVPGVNQGEGNPGLVRMARSSLEFTRSDATKAIRMAFDIGDHPADQGFSRREEIRWGEAVVKARFIAPEEPLT